MIFCQSVSAIGVVNTLITGRDQWRMQDFPEVRAPTLYGESFLKFPENCMKSKEF